MSIGTLFQTPEERPPPMPRRPGGDNRRRKSSLALAGHLLAWMPELKARPLAMKRGANARFFVPGVIRKRISRPSTPPGATAIFPPHVIADSA